MTPEEFEEYQRQLEAAQQGAAPEPKAPAVFRDRGTGLSDLEMIESIGSLREETAEQSALQFPFQRAPTTPIEPGDIERAQERALDELEEQIAVRARAGNVRSPVKADALASPYAGRGQVYGEDGRLRPLDIDDPRDIFASAFGRRLIAEGSDVREAARRVRMGEATREEAGLSPDVPIDFDAPEGGTGIYESYVMPPLKGLMATEAVAGEALFGRAPTSAITRELMGFGPGGRDFVGEAQEYVEDITGLSDLPSVQQSRERRKTERQKQFEQIQDRELLYYSVDEEGNPRRPEDPAYRIASAIESVKQATGLDKVEDIVAELEDKGYVEAAKALSRRVEDAAIAGQVPFAPVLSGVAQVGDAYTMLTGDEEGFVPSASSSLRGALKSPRLLADKATAIPAPFQPTTRYQATGTAIGAALDHDDFTVRVVDAIAKARGLGDEFVALPQYAEELSDEFGGDTVLGVHPAYASGMLTGAVIPIGPGVRLVSGLAGEVVRAAADVISSSATVRSLAARGAARQVLGQTIEAADAPSIKGIAASRAVNPVATGLEMQAVAAEALQAGSRTIKATDLAERFGGNSAAARILDQAVKATPGAAGIVENIDARILQRVARDYVMAGDAARVLRDLPGMTLEKAQRVVGDIVDPAARSGVSAMTKAELEVVLKDMLKTAGHAPNTNVPFLNSMYAMASRVQDDIIAGVPVGQIVNRSIKGMGAKGALFQKNLLRALVEEGRRAGKSVDAIISQAARGKVSPGKLASMAEALGDGRGAWAVSRAYRDTMTQSAKDAVMQTLPEDYRFLSRTMMVKDSEWKKAHNTLLDLMKSMYTITGTRGTGSVVTPNAGVDMSELVSRVVQEVGPGVLQAGEGYRVAKSMLSNLQAGKPMTADELTLFATSIQESLARDVPGIVQAVTEGAQTALAQGGVALRNKAYIDAATDLGIGRTARDIRRPLMALKESANLVVDASKGNSAASILIANPDNFVVKNLGRAASWVDERVLKGAGAFDYNPGTSVIAESYAREAQAAVANSADNVMARLSELSGQGIVGDDALTVVVKEQTERAAGMARARFDRNLAQATEQIDLTRPDAAALRLQEAERTSRFMMSNVSDVAGAESFRRGEGIIELALKQSGFRGGLRALRQMPVDDAIDTLRDAVVLAQRAQYNAEGWVNLIKTIIPGKTTQEMVLTGARAVPVSDEVIGRIPGLLDAMGGSQSVVTSSVAIRTVANQGGMLDVDGLLIPNITNLKKVMEVLEAANGKKVYEHSLRYSDIASFGQKLQNQAQDAWITGTFSWLTHQQAGLDSARIMQRLFDNHPELVLDLMPGTVTGAKSIQHVAVQSILNDMANAEEMITGKAPQRFQYRDSMLRAYDRLNGVDPGPMSDLDKAVYNLVRYVETMDMSLTPENRVALATKLFKASQAYGGRVPDVGALVRNTSEELLGRIPRTLGELSGSEQAVLKKHVTDMMARHEVAAPFEQYLKSRAVGTGKTVGRNMTKEYITNSLINGVVLGVDTSLISPAYHALKSLWQRTGSMLGSGQFAAGMDTTVLLSTMRTTGGQVYSMPMSNAVKRLEASVASGRLQSSLDALSIRAKVDAGEARKLEGVVSTAVSQVMQSVSRTINSTLLAGGGAPGFAGLPNMIYHARNLASVPEILMATIGAEMAVKAAGSAQIGLRSAARNARSYTFRTLIAKAIMPAASENQVVIRSPLYGNITARELDEMMDVANIKFSRASIEAYETIGRQMAEAAKMNLRTVFSQSGTPAKARTQFLRAFDPTGMTEWMKVAEDTDGITRRAVFAASLIDGRSIEDAALLARESLLDYGKVSSTGSGLEQALQRYLLFWTFRRQSLLTTVNALSDSEGGVFSRRDIMGRWIRFRQDQQKGVSPEEYLFGPDYKKARGMTGKVDDYGFNIGMPSVIGEGLGALLQYMSIPQEVSFEAGEGDFAEALSDGTQLALEAVEKENFSPLLSHLSKRIQERGKGHLPGPVVPDVVVGQALAFQNATQGAFPIFDMLSEQFNWVAEVNDEGVPVVTPARPTLRRESGRPYQLRFETRADATHYELIRLLQTMGGSGRTPDEYFRIMMTLEPFVPEGYEARYRAHAGMMAYIMGFETPSRATQKSEELRKLKTQVERKVKRARQ